MPKQNTIRKRSNQNLIAQATLRLFKEKEQYQARIDAGVPYKELAAELSISPKAFNNLVEEIGLSPRASRQQRTQAALDAIPALIAVVGRIADHLNLNAAELRPFREDTPGLKKIVHSHASLVTAS
jgi:hypothetical protein